MIISTNRKGMGSQTMLQFYGCKLGRAWARPCNHQWLLSNHLSLSPFQSCVPVCECPTTVVFLHCPFHTVSTVVCEECSFQECPTRVSWKSVPYSALEGLPPVHPARMPRGRVSHSVLRCWVECKVQKSRIENPRKMRQEMTRGEDRRSIYIKIWSKYFSSLNIAGFYAEQLVALPSFDACCPEHAIPSGPRRWLWAFCEFRNWEKLGIQTCPQHIFDITFVCSMLMW